MDELERRFEQLRYFNSTLETSSLEEFGSITLKKDKFKKETIEMVSNSICDRITNLINDRRNRLGIKGGAHIEKPTVNYDSFNPDNNGNLTFLSKNKAIYLGNIEEGIRRPSKIAKELGVNGLKSIGFRNITDEDVQPYRTRYVKVREKVGRLNENLDERSKAIASSSTTDAEAIELMEITFEDIDNC